MIEAEEEKRKAVFKGKLSLSIAFAPRNCPKLTYIATQQGAEEDFSWDDEVESETASEVQAPTSPTLKAASTPLVSEATTPKASSGGKMPAQPSVAVPTATATPAAAAASAGTTANAAPVMAKTSASTSTSPRDSEESYDLVSDQKKSAVQTEDDDSDWE